MSVKTERQGQVFGRQCWKEGLTVQETIELAAENCGLSELPENPAKWPKFVHGAEEAWQDQNLNQMNQKDGFSSLAEKYVKA